MSFRIYTVDIDAHAQDLKREDFAGFTPDPAAKWYESVRGACEDIANTRGEGGGACWTSWRQTRIGDRIWCGRSCCLRGEGVASGRPSGLGWSFRILRLSSGLRCLARSTCRSWLPRMPGLWALIPRNSIRCS